MIDTTVHPASGESAEAALRAELAHGDAALAGVLPVLRHLVAAGDSSMFSDEIQARVRGMVAGIAAALLAALPGPGERTRDARDAGQLFRALTDNPALLAHVHALALEWQLTERMQATMAIDPVVSPWLQSRITSPDSAIQELAIAFVGAQARWCQAQRRMELPLRELPADLFHGALQALRALAMHEPDRTGPAEQADALLRQSYDEGASRFGLAAQLVLGQGREADGALSLAQGGVALFLTALSLGSGQARDALVLSTHTTQTVRLVLALRAAGLAPAAVEEQVLALHPDALLPPGFGGIGSDMAASLLAAGHSPA